MKLNDAPMNFGGTGIALRKTGVEQHAQFKKITDTYSEYAKLVFLFDVSGSMNARIAVDKRGDSYASEYIWLPGALDDIKRRVNVLIDDMNNDTMNASAEDAAELRVLVNQFNDPIVPLYTDDDDLKNRIIKDNLMKYLGILPDLTKNHQEPPTRLGVLRSLAKQEIHARFEKYPQSRIAVIPFSGVAAALFNDGKPEEVDAAISQLDPNMSVDHTNKSGTVSKVFMDGGTDIMVAIEEGLNVCRKNPSVVGVHHIIVVTDGGSGINTSWTPILKRSGVVLDYIHIGDEDPNQALIEMCKELGGDCVTVNSEKDLKEKFVQAINRLLLPPATVNSSR